MKPWPLERHFWGAGSGWTERRKRRKLWRRSRARCGFPKSLWDRGEILPYPGWYEVWQIRLPRWLARRRKLEHGPYIYRER